LSERGALALPTERNAVKKLLLVLAFVLAVSSASAAQASTRGDTPQVRSLKRQVTALKAQVKSLAAANAKLVAANAVAVAERDAARSKLATAQSGTVGSLSTMTPYQLADTILPTVFTVFDTVHAAWQKDYSGPYAYAAMRRDTNIKGEVEYSYDFSVCSSGSLSC
jgi:hypothetical protein